MLRVHLSVFLKPSESCRWVSSARLKACEGTWLATAPQPPPPTMAPTLLARDPRGESEGAAVRPAELAVPPPKIRTRAPEHRLDPRAAARASREADTERQIRYDVDFGTPSIASTVREGKVGFEDSGRGRHLLAMIWSWIGGLGCRQCRHRLQRLFYSARARAVVIVSGLVWGFRVRARES